MKHYFLHIVLALLPFVAFAQSDSKVKKTGVPNNAGDGNVKPPNTAPIAMVYVEGGTFSMGSGLRDEESPVHTVMVSSFYMSKYEVTQKQWSDVMGSNPSSNKDCGDCPVGNVSWDDIRRYLRQLNAKCPGHRYRLPTEAEWECAAKGGKKSKGYEWAGAATEADLQSVAWIRGNAGTTHPAGSKEPNELGLYDMSGNVFEWCSDWYDRKYYASSPKSNPRGPQAGAERVMRGGHWEIDAFRCRSAYRNSRPPGYRADYIGFRVVSSK